MPTLQTEIQNDDRAAARSTLAILQDHARAARADVSDPVWRAGTRVPGVGPDLAAVAAVATAADGLAEDVMPPLVAVAGDLDPAALAPHQGRIALGPITRAAPQVVAADTAIRRAEAGLAAIDVGRLRPEVRSGVVDFRTRLARAAATTATAARAAQLLPPMLGADGRRTYLVVFQNLAEVRATGGMFGAYAVITADHGQVRIDSQGTAATDLRAFDTPVLPLDPAMKALYTDRLGRYPADVNFSPDFPAAAKLAREMYRRRSGRTVDGVLATDPVALSYVLAGTGPVAVPGGAALTSQNAVRALLSDSYAAPTSLAEKDQYFAAAARTIFGAMAAGTGNPRAVLAGLVRAAAERRLLVWSGHDAENTTIHGTVLDGALPLHDGATPTVGVFLNDGTGAKLGYYLRPSADVAAGDCLADGRRRLKLTVTLGSAAPARGLTTDVLGLALGGKPYTIRTNVLVFSPTGGGIGEALVDGRKVHIGTGTDHQRSVGVLTVYLLPGTQKKIEFSLFTDVYPQTQNASPGIDLRLTPTVNPWKIHSQVVSPCRVAR
ncbi:MAG: hypothetical protein QOD41_2391 [Cryptosporangiaceae bacterium]|nr:hypothetical protein [Cryptosporangiaceae bacterium]